MIVTKYGVEKGGWISAEGSSSFGASLWNKIRKKWTIFVSCVSWKVGLGNRILFWKHPWLEVGCLCDVFPDIFAIAMDKNALVSDYCIGLGINGAWNIHLRRNLNDWEWESYWSLLDLLYSFPMADRADTLIWKHPKQKEFTVKSFYQFLLRDEEDVFAWKKIWKAKVPTRVIFFSWCVVKGRILTMDNLKRREYYLVNRCPLCLEHEESIEHLLIHCSWSTEIWSLILSCFGI